MASNIDVKDAGTLTKTLKTTEVGSLHTPHHHVDTAPATAAEGGALPGVFMVVAGDDGTDTHPLQLDSAGLLRVTSTASAVAAESGALPSEFMVVAGDDGTNTHPLQIDNSTGGLKVLTMGTVVLGDGSADIGALTAGTAAIGSLTAGTADIGTVKLGAGTGAAIGKLAANSGVDIGDVDVTSVTLPTVLVQFLITIAATQAVMATHALKSGVTLKADAGNTGSVFIGLTGVAVATGHPLAAGDTLFLEIASTSTLYTIGTASDKLWVIGT